MTYILPYYFLISHAAELFLKSALLKRGWEETELRKFDYRHNLDTLLREIQNLDLIVTVDAARLINGLHSQHANHALRYTAFLDNGQKTYMPPPDLVNKTLEELLMLTRISTHGK